MSTKIHTLHIKVPDNVHKFMAKIKKDHGVNAQDFVLTAIMDKITKLKES